MPTKYVAYWVNTLASETAVKNFLSVGTRRSLRQMFINQIRSLKGSVAVVWPPFLINDNDILLRTHGPFTDTRAQKVVSYTSAHITETMFAHDQHREEQSIKSSPFYFSFRLMILLHSLRWCCVDCVIHHERDVREEQPHAYMWREKAIIEWSRWSDLDEWPLTMLVNLVNSQLCLRTVVGWSLLLLAATVRSFAHMPLGISDRNNPYSISQWQWNKTKTQK